MVARKIKNSRKSATPKASAARRPSAKSSLAAVVQLLAPRENSTTEDVVVSSLSREGNLSSHDALNNVKDGRDDNSETSNPELQSTLVEVEKESVVCRDSTLQMNEKETPTTVGSEGLITPHPDSDDEKQGIPDERKNCVPEGAQQFVEDGLYQPSILLEKETKRQQQGLQFPARPAGMINEYPQRGLAQCNTLSGLPNESTYMSIKELPEEQTLRHSNFKDYSDHLGSLPTSPDSCFWSPNTMDGDHKRAALYSHGNQSKKARTPLLSVVRSAQDAVPDQYHRQGTEIDPFPVFTTKVINNQKTTTTKGQDLMSPLTEDPVLMNEVQKITSPNEEQPSSDSITENQLNCALLNQTPPRGDARFTREEPNLDCSLEHGEGATSMNLRFRHHLGQIFADERLLPTVCYHQLSPGEQLFFTREMSRKHFMYPFWPMSEFAPLYLSKGTQRSLMHFCRAELDQIQILERFEKDKKFGERPQALTKEEQVIVKQETPERGSSINPWIRRGQDPIMLGNPGMISMGNMIGEMTPTAAMQQFGIDTIFYDITPGLKTELLEGIDSYNDKGTPEESDWFTFYHKIWEQIRRFDILQRNFVLLTKATSTYSSNILHTYQDRVRICDTECLARRIGRVAYALQDKNPVKMAIQLKQGQFGCSTEKAFYERVVELHYCRTDLISSIAFVHELFTCMSAKLPARRRERFYNAVFRAYPTLRTSLSSSKERILNTNGRRDVDPTMHWQGLPLPQDGKEMAAFSNLLIGEAMNEEILRDEFANSKPWEALLLLYPQYRPLGDYGGINSIKDMKIEEDKEDVKGRGAQGVSLKGGTPNRTQSELFNVHRSPKPLRTPEPTKALKAELKADTRTTPRSNKPCSHCNRLYHQIEECWLLHPELKTDKAKRSKADQRRSPHLKGDFR